MLFAEEIKNRVGGCFNLFSVAIDGPAGSGKSSVARAVAKKFKMLYLDTGALYRAVGFYMLGNGLFSKKDFNIDSYLDGCKIELEYKDGVQSILLYGEDVSDFIRTNKVAAAASFISSNVVVRRYLLKLQRDVAKENNVVMDGRDIGTVVLPNADVKIFLTASLEVRACRRYKELIAGGSSVSLGEVLLDIKARDLNDSQRDISPLKMAEDAIFLDSSCFSFDEVVEKVSFLVSGVYMEDCVDFL